MKFLKKMSEKQVESNLKPGDDLSFVNFSLQSQVAGLERTSSFAEDANLLFEFSDLSISPAVSPEVFRAGSLKSNVLETHGIDYDQPEKIVLSTDTDDFSVLEESDHISPRKNVKKRVKNQTKSFVDSYKVHGKENQENYLKYDDRSNTPKSQSNICFLSPSLLNRELIVPASDNKSSSYVVRIRKAFYEDALLPNAKTESNKEFIRHLIGKGNEADFKQNDSGSFMQEENFNTSDEMFCYSREGSISDESAIISEFGTGKNSKDSSSGRSYLKNISYCDEENSANFSEELYYTPCKISSNFMQKEELSNYIEENIFGESSIISKVESDNIPKNSPSHCLENQIEEITHAAKEVENDIKNTDSQSLMHEKTANLAEKVCHFSTRENNSYLYLQARNSKITNGTHKCDQENEAFLDQEETTASKQIERGITNTVSTANFARKLYHSTPLKYKSYEFLINSDDKLDKLLIDVHQCDLENEDCSHEEISISKVEEQIDFFQPEMVDMEKIRDNCIHEIINDVHHYDSENETVKGEISSTEKKQVDFVHSDTIDIKRIVDNCIDKIIEETRQRDLENETCFDEREAAEMGKIENEIKNTDSQSFILKNFGILTRKFYYSTNGENNPDDSEINSDNLKSEMFFDGREIAEIEKIEREIKNTDSQSLAVENFASLAEKLYNSTPGKNNPDHCIINSDNETSKIPNPYENDSEIEAFLKNKEISSTVEKEIDFIQPEIILNMLKDMEICSDEACLYMEEENIPIIFPNIFDMNTDQMMSELQQEFVNKVEIGEIEQSNGEQIYSQNLLQDKRPIHFTGVSNSYAEKSISNEFTKQAIFKENENLIKENVLSFMQEPHAREFDDNAIDRNIFSELSSTSQVVSNTITDFKRKLRPRKRKINPCNENLSKKRKTNTSKSPVEISNIVSKCAGERSNADFINQPVKMKLETEIVDCTISNSNVIYHPQNNEVHNEIQTLNLEQNRREVNKLNSVETLFDLFSIDQGISIGILKSLSSKELKPGALFIQIIRFLRQKMDMTMNTKIKEDVKKFLTAAMNAGWIEQKNKRYRLIGDVNLTGNEKQAKSDVAKGAKLSQRKERAKVIVSKRAKIPQPKKHVKAATNKVTKIPQPKKHVKEATNKVTKISQPKKHVKKATNKVTKISQPKKHIKEATNKVTKITQPKNKVRKSVGDVDLIGDKKQTKIIVTNETESSHLKKQRKAVLCKRKKVSQLKQEAKVSVSKKAKILRPKEAKEIATKPQISRHTMQLRK